MPADTVSSYGVQAILLSAWPWWMLIWTCCWIYLAFNYSPWNLLGVPLCLLCGIPPKTVESKSTDYNIVVANVNAFTGNEETLSKAVQSWNADTVVLIEKRAETVPDMIRVADDFSVAVPRPSHHMAVFCKPSADCSAHVSPQIGSNTMAMSYALLKTNDICVVIVHAPPPIPKDTTGMMPYLDALDDYIDSGRVVSKWEVCDVDDKVLLVGDLNAVPRSRPYQRILSFGLADQQGLSGLWRLSWPSGGGWINFPLFRLDHVFTHPELELGHSQIRIPDSDHKALKVWLPTD